MQNEKAIILNSSISALNGEVLLNRVFSQVIKDEYSMALWRMPNNKDGKLFVDFNSGKEFDIESLEEIKSAFVFAPFADDGKKLLIQGDLQVNLSHNKISVDPLSLREISASWLENAIQEKSKFNLGSPVLSTSTSADKYKNWVNKGIHSIKEGSFKKVVPARVFFKPWNGDAIKIFTKLSERYPNAFVSLTYTPVSGCWIGATPELLLSVNKDRIFATSALAGTRQFDKDVPLHNVNWTQKEIEEQAMVSRYIINCFKTIRLREFDEEGPMSVKAGNLVHLKTEFKVDMVSTNFPNLGSTMLKLLHPTSAICGMPREAAYNFLKETEDFDRQYFSGYLGPVNIENETNIFVNIRCARLFDTRAAIYAGAGVTSYSVAEAEWEETELKCKTLLDVMS